MDSGIEWTDKLLIFNVIHVIWLEIKSLNKTTFRQRNIV